MITKVNLGDDSYEIEISSEINLISDIAKIATSKKYNKIAIITDDNVYRLYSNHLKLESSHVIIEIAHGEKNKNISTVAKIIDELAENNITRKDLIIAVGGGVVGDIAGLVSSLYMRGLDFIQVPTTLLSMVDSSVGGKNGVDTPFGKNIIGTFKQPKKVLIYTDFLNTLDNRELNTGFAEIIKHSFIKDKNLFYYLKETNLNDIMQNINSLVFDNCNIKASVVEADEKESGLRQILNFGHTLGHAIEKHTNFEQYTHGEAISIGMAEITKAACSKGLSKLETYDELLEVLLKFNLPYEIMITNELLNLMKNDKKAESDFINYIVVNDIGKAFIHKDNLAFFSEENEDRR